MALGKLLKLCENLLSLQFKDQAVYPICPLSLLSESISKICMGGLEEMKVLSLRGKSPRLPPSPIFTLQR